MTSPVNASSQSEYDPLLDEFVEKLLTQSRTGQRIDLAAILGEHPEWASKLKHILPAYALLMSPERAADLGRVSIESDTAQVFLGQTLGDFRLIREIGRGGMGIVFEAEQVSLHRRVALKLLPFSELLDARHRQRFVNEARIAASINHPHIVSVYSVGFDRGIHYFAMQFIEGRNWAEVIDERPGNLSHDEIQSIVKHGIEVAYAVQYAHELGVIHRDIKPSNMLLDSGGKTWITDFGLARADTETNLTRGDELFGTLRYMSPEQIDSGKFAVDHRVDIYSLGATLYEMLTSRPVFDGTSRSTLMNQISDHEPIDPRRWNRQISVELSTVLLKSLSKNPTQRYASAEELGDDLNRYLRGHPLRARRPTPVEVAKKWCLRNSWALSGACLTLAVIAIVSSIATWIVVEKNRDIATALENANAQTREANFQSARLACEQGLRLCENGNAAEGLTWLVKALQVNPDSENQTASAIRHNIDVWSHAIHPIEHLFTHADQVEKIAFSWDGQRLLTATRDGNVYVRNVRTAQLERTLSVSPTRTRVTLGTHPSKNWVVVGNSAGEIYLFDLVTGQTVTDRRMNLDQTGKAKGIASLFFSHNGQWIACGDLRNECTIWPATGEKPTSQTMAQQSYLLDCAFSPDDTSLVTACTDGRIRRWQVPDGKPQKDIFVVEADVVHGLTWMDQQTLLLACQAFGASSLDLPTKRLSAQLFPHLARVRAIDAIAQPNQGNPLVATGSLDQTMQVWEGRSGTRLGTAVQHPGEVTGLAFSNDGKHLATVSGKEVRVCRLANRLQEASGFQHLSRTVFDWVWYDELQHFYALHAMGGVHRWSLKSSDSQPVAHAENASCFRVSKQADILYSGSDNSLCAIQTMDETLQWQRALKVDSLELVNDGRWLVAFGDELLTVIDATDGRTLHQFPMKMRPKLVVAHNPVHSLLAIGGLDGTVEVWTASAAPSLKFKLKHPKPIDDIRFSNDHDELQVTVANGQAAFWKLDGTESRPPIQLPREFKQSSFVPGQDLLIATAGNGTAQFFHMATATRIGPAMIHHGLPTGFGFSKDHSIVITRSKNLQPLLYHVPRPTSGSPEEISRRTMIATGLEITARGNISLLSGEAWQSLKSHE